MWADAQRDGRPLPKFSNSIPSSVPRCKVWLTPAAGEPCSNAANIGDVKWILHRANAKFRQGQEPAKNVYIMYQPRRRSNIVQSLVGLRWTTSLHRGQDAKPVEICRGSANSRTYLSR